MKKEPNNRQWKRGSVLVAVAAATTLFYQEQYKNAVPGDLQLGKVKNESDNRVLSPCRSLNIDAAKEGMICLTECKPNPNQTIEGLGLNPSEKITLKAQFNARYSIDHEFGKYHYHFPEENVYLNQTRNYDVGNPLQPTAYRERLFRRIIAKLYRAGVLDPSKNIVNTGSNIGDNALPWARMLEQLAHNSSKSPGKVYAIDPSSRYLTDMVSIANENSISNLCTHMSLVGAEEGNGVAKLDNVGIENLGLLHLDVEGHEGVALLGAVGLIIQYRPVIVTEQHSGEHGDGDNDFRVATQLTLLGYIKSNVVPEICGWVTACRNHLWWPDDETEAAAMAVVGTDFNRSGAIVPFFEFNLPESPIRMRRKT